MIRVLMIGQMSIVGGQQSFMMNYFRCLDKKLFEIDFLGIHGHTSPYSEEIERLGGHIYYWNEKFGIKSLLPSLKKLVKFIKKGKYDVVHANIYIGNCWFLVAARIAGVKVRISHSHCTFPLIEPSDGFFMGLYHAYVQKKLLLWSSTKLLACGKAAGKALYGNKQFVVMNNSIDIMNFCFRSPDAINRLKEEFDIKNEKVYASISRFDENKNLAFVVNIFEKIHRRTPNTILIIGGAEPYDSSTRQKIETLIENKKLTHSIRIVGTRRDLCDIMHVIDCWLFPSYHEGLPIVGVELQAASIPIIASDNITPEMDMGLGLVHYISLDNVDKWIATAIDTRKEIKPLSLLKEQFAKHGYYIQESVKYLEKIYLQSNVRI